MKESSSAEMGNYKFRLSDMMPNSWLYKLKGISRSTTHPSSHSSSEASSSRKLRVSHRPTKPLDSHFPDASPANKRTKRRTVYKPSPRLKLSSGKSNSAKCSIVHLEPSEPLPSASALSASGAEDDGFTHPANHKPFDDPEPVSRPRSFDIVIDIKDGPHVSKFEEVNGLSSSSDPEDLTASGKIVEARKASDGVDKSKKDNPVSVAVAKIETFEMQTQQKLISVGRKSNVSSSGIRLRVNSPKVARKKTRVSPRKSMSSSGARTTSESKTKGITQSFAIVLSTVDPERDFRESMIEMIVENDIREPKDLEDLLACYLSLNSSEYHDIIIKAFEKTWFHLTNLSL